jgi:hypothetical protein
LQLTSAAAAAQLHHEDLAEQARRRRARMQADDCGAGARAHAAARPAAQAALRVPANVLAALSQLRQAAAALTSENKLRVKAEMDAAGRPSWAEYRDVQLRLNHMAACIDWNVDVTSAEDPAEVRRAAARSNGAAAANELNGIACRQEIGEQRKLERFLLGKNRALESSTAALAAELVTLKAEVPPPACCCALSNAAHAAVTHTAALRV